MNFAARVARSSVLSCLAVLLFLSAGCGGYGGGNGGGGQTFPSAPTGLTAIPGDKQVVLSWTAVAGATGYYAKRSTTTGGPYTQLPGTGATNFTDTGLTNGTKYFYVVSAYNSYGQGANSAEVSATPVGPTPPAAPTGLTAAAASTQVTLTWNASVSATSYNVKRSSTSGGPYSTVSSPTVTNFTDIGLANGTKYYYVVSALNAGVEGPNSAEVNATPMQSVPAAPTGLTAKAGNAQVMLSWTASAGATSYKVKRSTTSGGPYSTVVASPTQTSYTDTTVTNGTPYFYVVTAVNVGGESANSNQATATPANVVPDVTITVNPANTKTISTWIYGTNFYGGNTAPQPKFSFDRDGGNRWTAYNWETNASNAGSDYLYESDAYLSSSNVPAEAVRSFIAGDQSAGLASLVTFQLQGYVSADKNGPVPRPFPNLTRFKQVIEKKSTKDTTPFTTTPPTTDAYVYMDEFAWALDKKFSGQGIFGAAAGLPAITPALPTFISLDNEPDLWYATHEEVQGSTNISPDNYISKTITLAKALKDQFPNLVIFGPVNYGFNGIYSWQGDPSLGPTPNGANWFADKYLAGIKAGSTAYGKGIPLVDVYDFHWYSEATDGTTRVTNMTGSTLTDAQVQAIVQSPRSLWDPTFTETSWITGVLGGPIHILGRLQAKIAANNPGMKLAITEYENGGFSHIAGTIAQADNLGIFGSMGLFAANFWPPGCPNTNPNCYSYTLAGFRAFRGFDGANASFGDTSLETISSDVARVVVYASSDSTTPGRIVFVAINRSSADKVTAINGQSLSGTAHLYQMTAATAAAQTAVQPVSIGTMAVSGSSMTITLPAYSVTTIDVR
jgi:fibronectin type 3 domain-containing protein